VLKYEKGSDRGQINGKEVVANHDAWRVSYNSGVQYAEPNLRASRDIKKVTHIGRTWCVTVPHDFVIVRRAHYDESKGYVTLASRPLVTGNCHAGINRSASLIVAFLMGVKGLSFDKAEHHLRAANTKRKVPVLTNKHFVHHMKNYPRHLAIKRHLGK
jgi:hypothetical protein